MGCWLSFPPSQVYYLQYIYIYIIYIHTHLYIYTNDFLYIYCIYIYDLHKWLKHIRVSISVYHRRNSTGCTSHISGTGELALGVSVQHLHLSFSWSTEPPEQLRRNSKNPAGWFIPPICGDLGDGLLLF